MSAGQFVPPREGERIVPRTLEDAGAPNNPTLKRRATTPDILKGRPELLELIPGREPGTQTELYQVKTDRRKKPRPRRTKK